MTTQVLRKILIAGAAMTALSLAACGKKDEAPAADEKAAAAAAAGASEVTAADAGSAEDQA
ncbi:hypothetical protein DMC18_17645, partial [Caulobacter sp. D5]